MIEKDPYELHNIASDSSQKQRIATYKNLLAAWMKEQGDEGAVIF